MHAGLEGDDGLPRDADSISQLLLGYPELGRAEVARTRLESVGSFLRGMLLPPVHHEQCHAMGEIDQGELDPFKSAS